MGQMRENFSKASVRALRDRAGNRCSRPTCLCFTVGADISTTDGVTLIGVAAHIHAASPGGPRYNSRQSAAERSSIKNAIWLCENCASLIDKNGGRNFSASTISGWKAEAERNTSDLVLFQKSQTRPDWLSRMHYAQFINVPRLSTMLNLGAELASLNNKMINGFRGLGMETGRIAAYVEGAIARSSIQAIDIDDILPVSDEFIGQIVSFNKNCFTKNGVDAGSVVSPKLLAKFDARKSPHFYIKSGSSKIIFPYDPAWVTTNTAYCDFTSGRVRFAGLGVVKRIDYSENQIFVSPLLVAFPRNDFMDAFYGKRF
ncbi:hypothetical protein [Methylorubrum extorquens]|uniref:hypothetical protein n=1 Tax=Methylorubrum extorquens TaxID=408 RepID=UPI00209EB949|nr:hypothetical protein [Methylorubrum extorquens]MCP1538408.1 hypothetical protein [Methylorubrum extorquens]